MLTDELTTYLDTHLSISRYQGTEGFSSIHNKGIHISGEFNDKSQIDEMFGNFIRTESFNIMDSTQIQELEFTFRVFTTQHVSQQLISHSFVISYRDGKGIMNIYYIKISPLDITKRTFSYDMCLINTDFVPSRPHIMITEHDSHLFKKSNIQRIHYLPRTVTSTHTNAIIHINETIINTLKKMNC
jgi:hypothetical protein